MAPKRLLLSALFLLPAIFADDRSFDFDPQADFSLFKTYTLNRTVVRSPYPELSEELARKRISEAVRTELAKKGLTERALTDDPKPDLIVNYRMGSGNRKKVETWIGPWGGAHRAVYRFTEGTLVVDMLRARAALWCGAGFIATMRRNPRSSPPIFLRMSRSCWKNIRPKRSRVLVGVEARSAFQLD